MPGGGHEGDSQDVFRGDGIQLCPGAVDAGDDAQPVLARQFQIIVVFHVEGLDEQAEIQQAVFQLFLDDVGVAGEHFDGQVGILLAQVGEGIRQIVDQIGDAGPNADAAGQIQIFILDFAFRLFHQGQDFFGPLAQVHPFFREGGAAVAADEQLLAQFLFQVGHLAGQGRLGDEQQIGSFGHVLFPGHRQEIFQGADFHKDAPFTGYV